MNKKYIVYILKSISRNWYYVGMTEDLARRLKQHNSGFQRSTKAYMPFELFYSREFENRSEARDFEKYLKIRSNKEKIINAEVVEWQTRRT
jgi:putative endonuclease